MPESRAPKIYLSYATVDREEVQELYQHLIEAGLLVFSGETDFALGSVWMDEVARVLLEIEIVIACVSQAALGSKAFRQELSLIGEKGMTVVPAFIERVDRSLVPSFLLTRTGVNIYEPDGFEKLSEGLKQLLARKAKARATEIPSVDDGPPPTPSTATLRIRKLSLVNIRCFEDFELELADASEEPTLFTMILGDNAAGKSTLLRSIVLGLSTESDASALIKQLPGSFVRRGADEGSIRLELVDPDDGRELTITTRISRNSGPDERVRKETDPDPFPWDDVFLCAYGTNRSRQAAASYETYSFHQAVLSLFDDDTVLQNPEVILLRQDEDVRAELERRLLSVLMLDQPDYRLTCPRTGAEIRGPWGHQPLRALSDGYRSTAQWVLDFLGWAIYAGRFGNGRDVGGILLVDELEQHLHPRWQRHVVQRLRRQFPKTQIFASTHTPLAAAGTADVEGARLLRLKLEEDGAIETVELDPSSLAGLRADQILASEAFGLYTTRNPGSEDDFARYAELVGKTERTPEEEAEMERLRTDLEASLRTGETEAEREVEQAVDEVLQGRSSKIEPEVLDLEAKRQLSELFEGDKAD